MAELTHKTVGKTGEAPPARSEERFEAVAPPIHPAPEQPETFDLRSLIELGCVHDSITIGSMTFEMRTLGDDEQEKIYKLVGEQEGPDSFVAMRRLVVAMSVQSVNGRPLEALGGEGEPIQRKLAVLKAMQSRVVDKLYSFYDQLLEKSQQEIDPEQVKN